MVVKSEIKHIKSLQQKKYRTRHGLFVAEGLKTVSELLASGIPPYKVYATDAALLAGIKAEKIKVSPSELERMSGLKQPNKVLGVFHITPPEALDYQGWILACDAVKDPGNLGTIIRLCDWFGIRHLLCSPDTVDCYNPKVLQATMGSIARVNIVYDDLPPLLGNSGLPVYGAFMDGVAVYEAGLPDRGILVMGNEAHGISSEVSDCIQERVSIPQYGSDSTESLNVATATAIMLSELRRPTRK
jgi:TrmH family RNA methyltransferase